MRPAHELSCGEALQEISDRQIIHQITIIIIIICYACGYAYDNSVLSRFILTYVYKCLCLQCMIVTSENKPVLSNLIPRAISAFKMAGGCEEDPGEEQVTRLQKYWRF